MGCEIGIVHGLSRYTLYCAAKGLHVYVPECYNTHVIIGLKCT